MNADAAPPPTPSGRLARMAPRSLSGRLLLLSALFVMIAEVFIFLPSAARFRIDYLRENLADAHLAVLAVDFMPEGGELDMIKSELLRQTGTMAISIRHEVAGQPPGPRRVMALSDAPMVDRTVSADEQLATTLIVDMLATMLRNDNRVLRVVGRSSRDPEYRIETVINEKPLREELLLYSWRIFLLSLVIASLTAALLFVTLRWILVRPLQRLTGSLAAFGRNPEDVSTMVAVSGRADEIGAAEAELRKMQTELRTAFVGKTRLAALGTAVTKFNHDLRNTLATAMLISDRLAMVKDETVSKMAKPLFETIDRAVRLCQESLNFARDGAPEINPKVLDLRTLVDTVGEDLAPLSGGGARWRNEVPHGVAVRADPLQLHRALANVCRNALEAKVPCVRVRAARLPGLDVMAIDVADDGPGIPAQTRVRLFQPFQGSTKADGSGLGLAIARDLLRAHGGDVTLLETSAQGTTFRITLPDLSDGAKGE